MTFVCKNSEAPDGLFTEFMHIFWCDDFDGTLIDSDDCNEGVLEWVPKSAMNDLPHWKGDEIFLDLIERRVPFFSLKLNYDEEGNLLNYLIN